MAFHIVLVEPEIPPNTGNIARTCAATGTMLHLIEPMGFEITDKTLKRAGLDYWPFVNLKTYANLDDFFAKNNDKEMYFVTTRGKHIYSDLKYKQDTMFLFGKETAGLDKDLLKKNMEKTIKIPMGTNDKLRSLNLSNSANIVIYEALRQHQFLNLV